MKGDARPLSAKAYRHSSAPVNSATKPPIKGNHPLIAPVKPLEFTAETRRTQRTEREIKERDRLAVTLALIPLASPVPTGRNLRALSASPR